MQRKNILFIGFGDLASRISRRLPEHRRVGLARSAKSVPDGVELRRGAVTEASVLPTLQQANWDAVVITLTPEEFSDEGYLLGYVRPMQTLVEVWQTHRPGLVLFVSSSSVYGQENGEWVDEFSETTPKSFSGKRLLQAESLLRASGVSHSILRLAGIYGPGREMLIRQVRRGAGGDNRFTNRIHADDCAGFASHLLNLYFAGRDVADMFVVCDDSPVPGAEVRAWLAQQLGGDADALTTTHSSRGGNKRCMNRRMRSTGYQLQYPDYRSGYRSILHDTGRSVD